MNGSASESADQKTNCIHQSSTQIEQVHISQVNDQTPTLNMSLHQQIVNCKL